MTTEFLKTALSTKVRFYPKSKHDLIRRSKLKKVRSFEDADLKYLKEITQQLIQELGRCDTEGPNRLESWRLDFELESRDYMINELFESMSMAVDLILSLNRT